MVRTSTSELSAAATALGNRRWELRLEKYGIDAIRAEARVWGKLGGRPRKIRGGEVASLVAEGKDKQN